LKSEGDTASKMTIATLLGIITGRAHVEPTLAQYSPSCGELWDERNAMYKAPDHQSQALQADHALTFYQDHPNGGPQNRKAF
jgi:hypothetical protein